MLERRWLVLSCLAACISASGQAPDCAGDRKAGPCDLDCNQNGIADACELIEDPGRDCNLNGVLDSCEPDCDGNGQPDACDLAGGAADCNLNGLPDACEPGALDRDANGVLDSCDVVLHQAPDCNKNGLPDVVDLESALELSSPFLQTYGSSPLGPALDIDGDNDLDFTFLIPGECCKTRPGRLRLERNTPLGFVHGPTLFLEPTRFIQAVADFDADGKSEIALASLPSECGATPRIFIVREKSPGVLEERTVVQQDAGTQVEMMRAADFDGDGDMDLLVVSESGVERRVDGLRLYSQTSDGVFSEGALKELQFSGRALLVHDMDGDGMPDLVRHEGGLSALRLESGKGGSFVFAGFIFLERLGDQIAAGDLDGDGQEDLITNDGSTLGVSWGSGAAQFSAQTLRQLRTEGDIFIADADEDGVEEAILKTQRQVGELTAPGNPALAFVGGIRSNRDLSLLRFAPAPLLGSILGLMSAGAGGGVVALMALPRSYAAQPQVLNVTMTSPLIPRPGPSVLPARVSNDGAPRLVAADWNGDGKADVAVTRAFQVAVHLSSPDGKLLQHTVDIGQNPIDVASADLDGDGDGELVTADALPASPLPDSVSILWNESGEFAPPQNFAVGSAPVKIILGDFDRDGDIDLLTVNKVSRDLTLLKNRGDRAFETAAWKLSIAADASSGADDFDADGDLDVEVLESVGSYFLFHIGWNDGKGSFGGSPFTEVKFPWPVSSLHAFDVDQDGAADILFGQKERYALGYFRNDRKGGFLQSISALPDWLGQITCMTALDLEGDRSLELAVGGLGPEGFSVQRASANSEFASIGDYSLPFSPVAATVGDADSDGNQDLYFLGFDGDFVTVLNRSGPFSRDANANGEPDECESVPDAPFDRGDANLDLVLDITDAVTILGALFLGRPAPDCDDARDSNDDGAIDITDAVTLLRYLFLGQAPPPEPRGNCGPDPTPDSLDCRATGACR